MKKLKDYSKLVKGRVYNMVYVGENKAFGRIDGKETFRVLETRPELKTVTLFDMFGDPHTPDLSAGPVTYGSPAVSFKDFELFEPTNETEWYKKSAKFTSLGAAFEQGLITQDDIEDMGKPRNRCPFMPSFGHDNKMLGVECGFSVEDKTKYPLLQTVFVVWPNWETLYADFKKFGVVVGK
ncbi:MAG: hypothetical protein V4467_02310 [Patescibacteria group bacterium]